VNEIIKFILWFLYVVLCILLIITIPICYVNDSFLYLVNGPAFPGLLRTLLIEGIFKLLTIDQSGATNICILIFLSILIDYFNYRDRLDDIDDAFSNDNKRLRVKKDEPAFAELISYAEAKKDIKQGLNRFEEELYWETRIDQYEGNLVALGLIGTLLAFYLGFARELEGGISFVDLDATATKLLMVVGTASISSISGIGLGMLGVRPLADDILKRIRNVKNTAANKIGEII